MAGGVFNLSTPKVRPGTYVNVINGKQQAVSNSPTGIVLMPLIGYDWGPREEWIHLTAESPDAEKAKFGRSVYDDNELMLLIRLAFMNATEVYAYIPGGGEKAQGTITMGEDTVTVNAKYPGTLGNKIKIVSVANPISGFDVSVVLDGTEVELYEGAKVLSDLSASNYVAFTGTGSLTAFASCSLSGGSDETDKLNASVTKMYDMAEKIKFHCLAFPSSEESLITALVTKIRYIRETIGWKCQAAVANTAADYEGIYNLVNAFEFEGKKLTAAQATAWLAGAVARADYTTSLTYTEVVGATAVVDEKTNEESVQAIKSGATFFSVNESGNVILEYDVNSKVTFAPSDPPSIYKGRPCRVYDSIANDLLLLFIPGKYENNSDGWSVMEGLGRALLQRYEEDGAITNVDLDSDFIVDTGQSVGDSVYITVGIQATDAVEKYYFTVITR